MRGQASVEMLMSYGWMFLAILLMIGMLYHLGVFFELSRMVQGGEGIVGFGSFTATAKVSPNGRVSLKLQNIGGGDVIVRHVSIQGEVLSSPNPAFPFNISRGETVVLNGSTTKINGSVGDRFSSVQVEVGFDTSAHAGHKDSAVMYGFIHPED